MTTKAAFANWRDTTMSIKIGEGMKFQRIRRITGYLVGTVDRFCNAKQKEEADRVKHDVKKGE